MRRIDVAALNVSLVCLGVAALALCTAFGTVDWKLVSIRKRGWSAAMASASSRAVLRQWH